jgi:hypothetical protein
MQQNFSFDLIILTESWITEDQFAYYPLEGYTGYICSRKDGTKSGGVIVFVRNEIPVRIQQLQCNTFEAIIVLILSTDLKKEQFQITGIYRDLRKNKADFIHEFELSVLQSAHQKSIITGDFNLDLLKIENSTELLNLTSSFGFQTLNNKPTRFGINKNGEKIESCLDHLYIRGVDKTDVFLDETGFSDHKALITTAHLHSVNLINKNDAPSLKIVTYCNRKKLNQMLQQETWNAIDFTTVNSSFESFFEIYRHLKNDCTETKTIRPKRENRKRTAWISKESLSLVQLKKELYNAMKKRKIKDTVYEELRTQFKCVSAELVKSTRKNKQQYYKNRLNQCKNSKTYWRELKNICKKDSKNKEQVIKLKNNDGELISDPTEIVDSLNKHYASIAEKEIEKNPLFRCNRKIEYSLELEKNSINSFGSHEITIYDLHKAVKKLTNKNSPANDIITAAEIKQHWKTLGIPLVLIFNYSKLKGEFPKILKKARIVPIPKVPNAIKFEDYRPISTLSAISKLFEIIIKDQMINYLMKQNFFSKNQFGFLPRRNCSEALQSHIFEITNNLEMKEKTIGFYIDISKAFDTVNHDILLDKLYRAGFRGEFHDWLRSYLTGREQCVKYNSITSTYLPVVSGVPQGSTLGPILFLIYVNSLLTLQLNGPVFSFADDTAVVYSGGTIHEAIEKCELDLQKLNNWFRYHKICPNLNKTQAVHYHYKRSQNFPPPIIWHLPTCNRTSPCNCTKIEFTPHVKYLGLILNNNLNWEQQSLFWQKKLRKLNYLLYYVRHAVPLRVRVRIYKAFYEPVLIYGLECWGGAADYVLRPILVLQKFAIRTLVGANRLEHTAPIFSKLRILPLKALYERALASVLHREAAKGETRLVIPHNHDTRHNPKFPLPRKWFNKKATRQVNFQVPSFGSTLPENLLQQLGRPCFLKNLKIYLFDKHKI